MSKQVGRGFWLAQVEAWRASGLSQAEYGRQQGLSSKRLSNWAKRFEQPPAGLSVRPIRVAGPAIEEPAGFELLLRHPSGWQLAVPSGIGAKWLASLLKELR